MQMPQGLAAQHGRELFLSGKQFPSGEKGGRLLCSAFTFPRLNCSRREVLKLVSPHNQLLATRGKTGADRSPHAQSHRKTAIPATMQMRIRLGGV